MWIGVDEDYTDDTGEIKALATGNIEDGETIVVGYEFHVVGEYEIPDYDGTYPVREPSLPAVTAARSTDQAALIAVRQASDPLQQGA